MAAMTFKLDPEIILGTDVLNRIGAIAVAVGQRAFIISGQGDIETRVTERITALLEDAGVAVISFDAVPVMAAADTAEKAGALANGSRCSLIISVGGPEIQALARIVAIIGPSKTDVFNYLDGEAPPGPFLPWIAVPTGVSDPFLFAQRHIVLDPRSRLVKLMAQPAGMTRTVFLDSRVCGAAPSKYPAAPAFEGFLASLEAWCSSKSNAVSDALLERSLASFASLWSGDSGASGDEEGVDETGIQAACLLAMGAAISAPGPGTALTWALTGRFPVDRSLVASAFLPHVAERLAAVRPEKAARAAYLAGVPMGGSVSEGAGQLAGHLREALETAGVPARLRELGLNLDRMAAVAEAGRSLEFVAWSPWTVDNEDAFKLLEAAF